jgi:hypothetical protein
VGCIYHSLLSATRKRELWLPGDIISNKHNRLVDSYETVILPVQSRLDQQGVKQWQLEEKEQTEAGVNAERI